MNEITIQITHGGKLRKSLLSYAGGKTKLAPYIKDLIPPHRTYIEVFGGGASLLFAKEPSQIEVYNDIDSSVVNVFRVLRDEEKAKRLQQLLEFTPYSREEFEYCKNNLEYTEDDVELARRTIVKFKQSYGGKGDNWGYVRKPEKNRKISTAIGRWNYFIKDILDFASRLKWVEIENLDFRELIPKYDFEDAFFFLDPPYICKNKTYANEMDLNDHEDLINLLLQIKGKAMICGFDHEIYHRLDQAGWKRIGFKMKATIPTQTGIQPEQIHYLWLNYDVDITPLLERSVEK